MYACFCRLFVSFAAMSVTRATSSTSTITITALITKRPFAVAFHHFVNSHSSSLRKPARVIFTATAVVASASAVAAIVCFVACHCSSFAS